MKGPRNVAACLLLFTALAALPGCLTPNWAKPINPWKNDGGDRAKAALKAKDYVLALQFYGEIVANQPDDMLAHYQLAQINQELGRYEEALRLYRVVYVSGNEDPAPLPNGDLEGEMLFRAAERNIRLLQARLGITDGRMGPAKEN